MGKSLTEVAELINFDYTNDARAEFYPIDETQWTARFAELKESTCIYLAIEN